MTAPKHPAKFSDPIIDSLRSLVCATSRDLGRPVTVLDPFAGTGRVHRLARDTRCVARTVGVEIEREWAEVHPDTIVADSILWMRARARRGGSGRFDVIATSPCYGNRFSDSHNAQDGSTRRSYTHDLGRALSPGSSGAMPWGPRYWQFHADAYRAMHAVLVPGGRFLLNVSDFHRQGEEVHAVEWHLGAAYGAGFVQVGRARWIETRRLRGHGSEATAARAPAEAILVLGKPT